MILENFKMAEQTYTPLFSEILDKVAKAKTKDKKIAILREHKTDSLKMILKAAFIPLSHVYFF